jgi:hypothetical protein
LSAKAVSFDSTLGRWDYLISYSINGSTTAASLNIGTMVLQSGLSGSGSVDTGAILKPKWLYHVSLSVSDPSGVSQTVARLELKTSKGKVANQTSGTPSYSPVCSQGSSGSAVSSMASSTPPAFCIQKDDGSTVCAPPPCGSLMPPPIGNSSSTSPEFRHPQWTSPSSTPPNWPPTASSTPPYNPPYRK